MIPVKELMEGRRSTEARRVILEELAKVTTHPTAYEVYQMVRRRLPKVSLGTVYRNLDLLARSGLVLRLGSAQAQMRFDGCTRLHHHIRCAECGRVDDLHDVRIAVDMAEVRNSTDYQVLGVGLELLGLCPDCRKRRQPGHRVTAAGRHEADHEHKRRNAK